MKFDVNSLNEEQQKALVQTEGVVLVTAGAGSGKTILLTHRICYLLQKGVNPYNILAITFTNKATKEMQERVANMTDAHIWISTFHSMCVKILRQEIEILGDYTRDFSIVDESDRDKIIKELLKKYQCDEDDKDKVSKILDNIKNNGSDIDDYFEEIKKYNHSRDLTTYKKICYEYEEHLRKNNALDFDDLLNKTLFLFNNYGKVLQKYSDRFEYILVDEFQDTNLVQYKLLKLLCGVHKNLFVVGDEDQCIYSWRGANFHNIFNLQKDFQDVHVFKLERNYRSTKNILNLANNVIANNKERLEKKLWTEKDYGDGPIVFNAFDEIDEARFVAGTILELCSQGYSLQDFAVLMRVNALSRSFEDAFLMSHIPYRLYGGFKFYERAEVKIVLAYLNMFVNPRDEISLLKIINFPKRGIGESAIANLQAEAGEQKLFDYLLSDKFAFSKYHNKLETFVEGIKELKNEQNLLTITDFVEKIVKKFNILSAFKEKDEQDKIENIDSLISGVREFEEANPDSSLADFLANVMLKSDNDNIQEDSAVSLATIHSVKGLEFRVVFVVGLEEGLFPLAKAMNSNSEMEEERRLMYVAVTRAEEKIFLTYAAKRFMYGKSNYQKRSRFVDELHIIDKSKPKTAEVVDDEKFESGFAVGDVVMHSRFGKGVIENITSDGLVADIDFEEFGTKSLMLNLASLEKCYE